MPRYQSLYDILGISKTASADEVRKAYRKKALETHPDKLSPHATAASRHAAEAEFHLIHNAFETLSDPHRRKAYDAWGSKLDPKVLEEESAKRKEDRDAWANKFKSEYEQRKLSRDQPVPPISRPTPKPIPRPPTQRPINSAPSKPKTQPPPRRPQEPPLQPQGQNTLSEEEEKMIAEMLEEVRLQLPPDYEERRRRALQKKAERERAEMRRQTMPG